MADPRAHQQETPEGDICWFEWGTAGAAPSLLLLHATGFHARLWDEVVAGLPPGTHAIAPDHRGHGRSFKPRSLFDWTGNGRALLPLVDRFAGRRFIGCGHSMGGFVLSWLATERPRAFDHIVLIDPVIMDPALYRVQARLPVPDPAEHPVARRRSQWASADAMRERFADRLPYSRWHPQILDDYCNHGLLPVPHGDGYELACPPALEASMYQNALRSDPYCWLGTMGAPVTLLRAPIAAREGALDFSQSPTWLGLGARIGAVRDELCADNSHFIPMESPGFVAALLDALLENRG